MKENIDYEKYIDNLISKEGFFEDENKKVEGNFFGTSLKEEKEEIEKDGFGSEYAHLFENENIEVDFDILRKANSKSLEVFKEKIFSDKELKMQKINVTIFTTINCIACNSVKKTLYCLKGKLKEKYNIEITEVAVENAETRKKYNVYVFPTVFFNNLKTIGSKREDAYVKIIESVIN